jgi:hypothetical protein
MGLFLAHLRLEIFVAGEAHVRAVRQKQVIQLCLVGTVAFRAVAGGEGLVLALGSA